MATHQEITLSLPSIHCGGCVKRVNTALGALPGVEQVSTDAATKTTSVQYDPEQLSREQIETALSDAGYPAARELHGRPKTSGKPLTLL